MHKGPSTSNTTKGKWAEEPLVLFTFSKVRAKWQHRSYGNEQFQNFHLAIRRISNFFFQTAGDRIQHPRCLTCCIASAASSTTIAHRIRECACWSWMELQVSGWLQLEAAEFPEAEDEEIISSSSEVKQKLLQAPEEVKSPRLSLWLIKCTGKVFAESSHVFMWKNDAKADGILQLMITCLNQMA